METTIINCDCLCHSLHVRPDVELKTVDISLWNYGFNDGKLDWKKRFKILFDGFAYSDLVVLDKDELDKLIATYLKIKKNIITTKSENLKRAQISL
jgi:hypothetical protein